MRHNRLCIS